MKKPPERPVLITDAARSPGDQLRSREIRYAIMMGIRVLCLVVGTILISVHPPLLWLWITLCAVGVVVLPWAAVLLANDRPAKSKEERAADKVRNEERRQAQLAQYSAEEQEYITIDVEPTEAGDKWIPTDPGREKG